MTQKDTIDATETLVEVYHEVDAALNKLRQAVKEAYRHLPDEERDQGPIAGNIGIAIEQSIAIEMALTAFALDDPQSYTEKVAPAETNLHRLATHVVHLLKPRGQKLRRSLAVLGTSTSLIPLYPCIESIFIILADNALKYSVVNRPGTIEIVDSNGVLKVSFGNFGPMVEESEQSRIFDHGYRGSMAVESGFEGKGLGLSRAKKLAEINDIVIRTRSEGPIIEVNNIPYQQFFVDLIF